MRYAFLNLSNTSNYTRKFTPRKAICDISVEVTMKGLVPGIRGLEPRPLHSRPASDGQTLTNPAIRVNMATW